MPLNALPDVFLPSQQELWTSIDHNALTIVEKSRRTGYTWTVAAIAVGIAAAAHSAGGKDVIYTAYEKTVGREFIDYCADWAKAFAVAAGEMEEQVFPDPDNPDRTIWTFRIHFDSGFDIVALPSVPRSFRGRQGVAILDEAAFMTDLPGMLTAAYAYLIHLGKVVVISTHNGEDNPFNALINEVRGGKRGGVVLRFTFDQAQGEGLFKRICLREGKPWSQEAEDAWRAEIFGIYRANADEELNVIPNPAGGAYLTTPLIEARMRAGIPVLRLERTGEFTMWPEHMRQADIATWIRENLDPVLKTLDQALPHCFGFDFARKGDLSVFIPAALGRDLVRRVPFTLEMHNVPFAQQRQVLWHIIKFVRLWRAGKMDATGNGAQIAEETVQQFGTWIEAVMLNEPWYRANMPPYKAAFEEAMLELPRDDGVLDDHRSLKIVRGVARVPERTLSDDGKQRHGDAAIAGVLMYAASRADPEFYGYDAASTRRSNNGVTSTGWRDRPDTWAEDHPPPGRGLMPPLRGGIMPMRGRP
jgi:phage FluMu gp28-like protein